MTQIGHNSSCSNRCSATSDSYMNNSGNRASACSAAKGLSIVTYWSVGTQKYQTGKTYTCPQTNSGPQSGGISLPGPRDASRFRKIFVDDIEFYSNGPPPPLQSFKSPFA